MRYLLKNGTVVSGEKSEQMDILIEGEKIAAVGHDLQAEDAKVIDAEGKLLFPGFIDGHTQMILRPVQKRQSSAERRWSSIMLRRTRVVIHSKKVSKNGIKKQITNVPVTILSTCQS